jgi:hypothetical protein
VGGQAHSVAQASSRADFSKSRHRIVMGGLKSMRAQELQCVAGACMRGHARVHASEIRSARAKQSGNNVMRPQLPTA